MDEFYTQIKDFCSVKYTIDRVNRWVMPGRRHLQLTIVQGIPTNKKKKKKGWETIEEWAKYVIT